MYKRVLKLAKPYWHILTLSVIASLAYVFFNSLSVWITASLINNILTDFETLSAGQKALESASSLSLNESLKLWTNRLVLKETQVDTLKALCVTILIVFLMKNLFQYLKNLLTGFVQISVVRDLRNRLFNHITSLSLSYFDKTRAGTLTSIVLHDVNNIRRSLSVSFHRLLVEPINILMFTVLLMIISWKLTLAVLVILPLAGFVITVVGRSIRRKVKRTSIQVADITATLTETLSAIRVVKAFVMEKTERLRFGEKTARHRRLVYRQMKLRYGSTPVTETIGVVVGVILLWVGGMQVIDKVMNPEDFIRFILIMFSVLTPIRRLNTVNQDLQTAMASAERVFGLLDKPQNIIVSENAKEIERFEESIQFDNVSFSYDGSSDSILNNVNLEIRRGDVVAVVGESGAGKSTMADLIPRFYDVLHGAVRLDGIDVRDIKLDPLRKLMGIVPQETFLFNDTIRNNISYGTEGVGDESIREAAIAANALEFIEEQSGGFDEVVGDRGVKLSGGQRQRISVARALIKNPPILILDEATSSLDSESEIKVQEAIDRLMRDRTVFVIAHRLSTVVNADKIVVLKDGSIVEEGTHDELLHKNGEYRRLYEMQFRANSSE